MYNEHNNVGRASVLALRGKYIPQARVLILALKLVVNMEEGIFNGGGGLIFRDHQETILQASAAIRRIRTCPLVFFFSYLLHSFR